MPPRGPVDWLSWHQDYADPCSALSRRRRVVQGYVRTALAEQHGHGPTRLISLCAGDGGDLLQVLGDGCQQPARALLVELNAELAQRARQAAAGLPGVEVVTGDAGLTWRYQAFGPADIVLAVGVFGNLDAADLRRTVRALPALLQPGGLVVWTRGRGDGATDASIEVRGLLAAAGFDEVAVTVPDDARYRAGLHRLRVPATDRSLPERLFSFR